MQVAYSGPTQRLSDAAAFVNALDGDAKFWRAIRDKSSFDHSNLSGRQVADRIQASTSTVTVKIYTPKKAATIAATDPKFPHKIFYSKNKRGRSVGQMVNTLVHEFVHNVDLFDDGSRDRDMGHGDNEAEGKGNTAPYWIGDLAQARYAAQNLVPETPDPEPFSEEFEVDPDSIIEDEQPDEG